MIVFHFTIPQKKTKIHEIYQDSSNETNAHWNVKFNQMVKFKFVCKHDPNNIKI